MSDWDALGRKFGQLLDTAQHRRKIKARTGRIDPSTGLVDEDPNVYDQDDLAIIPNRLWVRIGATRTNPKGRGQVAVWNWGKVRTDKADLPVVLDYNDDNDLEIVGADAEAANAMLGAAGQAFYQPDPPPPELARNTLITRRSIMDFRPYRDPDLGGLYLYVHEGWYGGAKWNGGSILLTPTATANKKAWVVVGFDESTGALVQALGTDYSLAYTELPESDIATTFAGATFANARPICAVPLANGATTFTNGSITDIRDITAVGSADGGDMLKATYDTDDDGLVEKVAFEVLDSDPASPEQGQAWVLKSADAANSGSPIGLLLALTKTAFQYELSVYADGATRRVTLS